MVNNLKLSWSKIHTAIHDGSDTVVIDGKPRNITVAASNGCRNVVYTDTDLGRCIFMEQNKKKDSGYAVRARNGETLTWVIPYNKNKAWQLIDEPVKKKKRRAHAV